MKEEKKAGFTQKWIENAVKKLLQKEDIYESDMEQIKYLRIGDQWKPGGEGAVVTGKFIQLYIDYMKENPFDYIDPATEVEIF